MESALAALSITPEHAQVLGDIWGILDAQGPIFSGRRCAPEGLKGGRTPPKTAKKQVVLNRKISSLRFQRWVADLLNRFR